MYDLTPLLSSIAGCSGTFIAIVGGFIARKLISISQERHSLEAKMVEAEEEIKKLTSVITSSPPFYETESGSAEIRPVLTSEQNLEKTEMRTLTRLDSQISQIEKRQFQVREMQKQLENLKNPHGMKRGLLVFVVFSVLGVLVPMSLSPFQTDSFTLFLSIKISVILLFALCLLFAYNYFLYLLRWKNKEVVDRWKEYIRREESQEDEKE